jgi:plastocyanin
MSRRIITALSCGALALGGAFVTGCGDDNNDSGSADTTTEATPAPAATGGDEKNSVITVSMKANRFIPEKVTGKVGQTVEWKNDDSYPHNVVATKGEDFQSDNFGGGGTYKYKLDKAGKISYVCTIHSGMVGTITVTQ